MAVIAILAGLLLPALFKAKDRALLSNDLNNIKQIVLRAHMFSADNGDYLPYRGEAQRAIAGVRRWHTRCRQKRQSHHHLKSGQLIGQKLGITEGNVKVAVHRLRKEFGEILRSQIAETVVDQDEINEEIRQLIRVTGGL